MQTHRFMHQPERFVYFESAQKISSLYNGISADAP
jgi:hypothetical protein